MTAQAFGWIYWAGSGAAPADPEIPAAGGRWEPTEDS